MIQLIFYFLLLFLAPVNGESDRLSISFRFHSFKEINSSSLSLQVVSQNTIRVFGGEGFIVGHGVGNNTFLGKMNMPWKTDHHIGQLRFTIVSEHFLQKDIMMSVKAEGETHLKLTTEDFRAHLTAVVNSYDQVNATSKNGCGCVKKNCACCETIRLVKVKFDHTICANISYNPETIGLQLAVGIDGHFYVLEEISARNPPPICFDVPGIHEIADVCIAIKKLDLTRQHFAGCVEIEFELAHLRMIHIPLGCFDMPI